MIFNVITENFYIGSTYNYSYRIRGHFRELQKRKHHNYKLQKEYDKFGASSFVTATIEICDDLLDREQFYIDTLNPRYNIALSSSAPMKGRTHSEETKKILSEFQKNNNGMSGKQHSKESKMLMSRTRRGKKLSDEHIKQCKSSKYARESKPTNHVPFSTKVICKNTGEVFDTMNDAAKKYGIRQGHISEVCKGIRRTAGGYSFEYVDPKFITSSGMQKVVYIYI